jgi:hypothetical protein
VTRRRPARAAAAPAIVDDPALLGRQARRNALRTFLQGLGIDVLVALSLLAVELTKAETLPALPLIGAALVRTVVGAAASYVMRRYVDGSRIPTPLPIAPTAAPAETEGGRVITADEV